MSICLRNETVLSLPTFNRIFGRKRNSHFHLLQNRGKGLWLDSIYSQLHSSIIGNKGVILAINISCSTLSPEGESDSESSDSEDDLESPGRKAPSVPFENGDSPQGSPVKQPPQAADNKMEVDPADGMSGSIVPLGNQPRK